jgi:hypothetical protein
MCGVPSSTFSGSLPWRKAQITVAALGWGPLSITSLGTGTSEQNHAGRAMHAFRCHGKYPGFCEATTARTYP